MGSLKISVHPLFFIFGLYFAACGKVFSFLVFTLCALVHELGHAYASEKCGYKLKNIKLMPYGAVISGDIDGIRYSDEIKVVVAGPLVNAAVAAGVAALWWFFPETYPYTELAFTANAALFAINLIPAYPLDGGRLLLATLSLKAKRKTAVAVARVAGLVCAGALITVFALTAAENLNLSLRFFSLFMLFGAADANPENAYVRAYTGMRAPARGRAAEIREIAVGEDCTVKRLFSLFRPDCMYRVRVYAKGGVKVIEPDEVGRILEKKSIYDRIL